MVIFVTISCGTVRCGQVKTIELLNKETAMEYSILDLINEESSIVDGLKKTIKTSREFKADIYKIANTINEEKKLLLISENSYTWLVILFAGILTGKTVYIMDPSVDIEDAVRKIKPDIVFDSKKNSLLFNTILSDSSEDNNNGTIYDMSELSRIYLYSTGTANARKSILFNTNKLVKPAIIQGKELDLTENDRTVILAPFSHAYGMSAVFSALSSGSKIYILNNSIDLMKILLTISADCLFVPPAVLKVIFREEKTLERLRTIRRVVIAGAKLDEYTYNTCLNQGIRLLNLYGSTETGMCYIGASRPGQKGNELFLSEIFQMMIGNGNELYVKSEATGILVDDQFSVTDQNGWYHTGDMIMLNENDSFTLLGRADSIEILNNGNKVNLEELENRIIEKNMLEDCQVFVEHTAGEDIIVVAILKSDRKDNLLQMINSSLQYYETVRIIRYVSEIKKKRGKKRRLKREKIESAMDDAFNLLQNEMSIRDVDRTTPFFKASHFNSLQSLQFIMIMEEKLEIKIDIISFEPSYTYDEIINFFIEQASVII